MLLTIVFWMNGIFHLQLLLAAGDTLCPLISTMEETAGCTTEGSVAGTSLSVMVLVGTLEQVGRFAGEVVEGQMAWSGEPL